MVLAAANPARVDALVSPGSVVVREAKLTARGAIGLPAFGFPVVLSAHGDVALIGGSGDDHNRGAAWVFIRRGSRWVQQAKLVPRGEVGAGAFGLALALSANGRVALIGAPADAHNRGAVWVFTPTGARWQQDGNKLTGGEQAGAASFGYSVALSGDGTEALVGGPDDRPLPARSGLAGYGAMWAFRQTGRGWRQVGAKVTPRQKRAYDFGLYLALASDGKTALVGSYAPNDGSGAAWVFVATPAGWAQQGSELRPRDEIGKGSFGGSVALSADGQVALIGGSGDNRIHGAAWVFTRAGDRWTQAAKLIANDATEPAGFGIGVALSANGQVALIGGGADNRGGGAAWLFKRTTTAWTQEGPKITGAHELLGIAARYRDFGGSVSLSGSATTALIGGFEDNRGRGAAWILELRSHPCTEHMICA